MADSDAPSRVVIVGGGFAGVACAKRLADHEYLAGEYSIADVASYPWVARHEWHQVELADFPNVKRWYEALGARAAVQKGMQVPS